MDANKLIPRNPTGKGGFGDNPQNINVGGKKKNEQRFGYWLQFFKNMPLEDFLRYQHTKKKKDMYVAEAIAYERVLRSVADLKEYQDLANRTEGMPKQSTDITSGGEKIDSIYAIISKASEEDSGEDSE